MKNTILKIAAVVAAACGIGGCQMLGPQAINAGRGDYNEAIQETGKQQTLGNLVRVYKRQPPLFMDVTEVAATQQIQAQLVSSVTNAAAPTGTTRTRLNQGTLQYLEAPLVRYVPVLGSALTTQVATPISADSLAFLTDSNWPLAPVFTLAANYLTPSYSEYYPALNAILELDEAGVIAFAQAKSDLTGDGAGSSRNSFPLNDSLVMYLAPRHPYSRGLDDGAARARILRLWLRLLRIYAGTQPQTDDPGADARLAADKLAKVEADLKALMDNNSPELKTFVEKQFDELRNWIELRMAPVVPAAHTVQVAPNAAVRKTGCVPVKEAADKALKNCTFLGPLMRTRSALGILKAATEVPAPMIEFVPSERYKRIREAKWTAGSSYYTLSAELEGADANPDEDKEITREVSEWIKKQPAGSSFAGYSVDTDITKYRDVLLERRLGHFRRFVLIVESDSAPRDAYVSFRYQGKTYYIASDDEISQRNFVLLSQFTVMQATPSPSTFTPTISVGAK